MEVKIYAPRSTTGTAHACASTAASLPSEIVCPITTELMREPVLAADGHTYERAAIEEWFANHSTSPLTGEELDDTRVMPNHAVRAIARWFSERNGGAAVEEIVV